MLNDKFRINWAINHGCNYRCSYCYCDNNKYNKFNMMIPLEVSLKFLDNLSAKIKQKNLDIWLSGGEPTLAKEFLPICQYIKNKNGIVNIHTNAARAVKWWEEYKEYFDMVYISYHIEHSKFDHINNILSVLNNKAIINMMMIPNRFNDCLELSREFQKNHTVYMQPLIKNMSWNKRNLLYNYTKDQRDIIYHETKDPLAKLIISRQNNWIAHKCNIGKDQIVIFQDGTIMRGWCGEGGKLGNVINLDMNLPTNPAFCSKDFCHCKFDMEASKTIMKPLV